MIKVIRDQGAPIVAKFKDISPGTAFIRNETAGAFIKADSENAFAFERHEGGSQFQHFQADDDCILVTAELHIKVRRRELR